jgi:ankyrin repeat protein
MLSMTPEFYAMMRGIIFGNKERYDLRTCIAVLTSLGGNLSDLLTHAVIDNDLEMVKSVHEMEPIKSQTAAFYMAVCAKDNKVDMVSFFGTLCSDTGDSHTPIVVAHAVESGKLETLKEVIGEGNSVNEAWQGMTPLQRAAKSGNIEIFDLLVHKGARLDVRKENGFNLFMVAIVCGNTELVGHLLKHYSTHCTSPTKEGVLTPLHVAAKHKDSTCLELLVADGRFVGDIEKTGGEFKWTPLMFAASHGGDKTLECLLHNGASLEPVDVNGNTALELAIYNKNNDLAKYIINNHKKTLVAIGLTPLNMAIFHGNDKFAMWLVASGNCDPNKIDANGISALECAITRKTDRRNITLWLIACGGAVPCDNDWKAWRKLAKMTKVDKLTKVKTGHLNRLYGRVMDALIITGQYRGSYNDCAKKVKSLGESIRESLPERNEILCTTVRDSHIQTSNSENIPSPILDIISGFAKNTPCEVYLLEQLNIIPTRLVK